MLRKQSLDVAIANITRWGDTDVFPKPIDNHVIAGMPTDFAGLVKEIDRAARDTLSTRPPSVVTAAAPVGYAGFRRVTQLDPVWNAYMLAAVVNIFDQIESVRVPASYVFSHRMDPKFASGRLFEEGGYRSFVVESRRLAEMCSHVVTTDIADFYGRIYHHRLENALLALPRHGGAAKNLASLLQEISGGKSYGLPVGGPAARVLAELLLDRTDKALVSSRIQFVRYADDYRLFAKSEDAAYGQLASLSELLAVNEGLTLQKAKTRVMTSAEYIASVDLPGSHGARLSGAELKARQLLSFSLRFDPYSDDPVGDYEELESEVDKIDLIGLVAIELSKSRIDPQFTKKLLKAVQFARPNVKGAVAESLCLNLALLAPVLPQVFGALKGLWSELTAQAREFVTEKLLDLWETDSYLLRPGVSRAYWARVLAEDDGARSEAALMSVYADQWSDQTVRRDVVLALARRPTSMWWLSALLMKFRELGSTQQRTALLVSTAIMTEEAAYVVKRVKRSLSPFEQLALDWALAMRKADPTWLPPI